METLARGQNIPGIVYLLHFDRPYIGRNGRGKAAHYLGWAERDLQARLDAHATGTGARLLAVLFSAGIGFELARTWAPATRNRERQLKRQGSRGKLCPICHPKPRINSRMDLA